MERLPGSFFAVDSDEEIVVYISGICGGLQLHIDLGPSHLGASDCDFF